MTVGRDRPCRAPTSSRLFKSGPGRYGPEAAGRAFGSVFGAWRPWCPPQFIKRVRRHSVRVRRTELTQRLGSLTRLKAHTSFSAHGGPMLEAPSRDSLVATTRSSHRHSGRYFHATQPSPVPPLSRERMHTSVCTHVLYVAQVREEFPNGFVGRNVGGMLQYEAVQAMLDDHDTLQVHSHTHTHDVEHRAHHAQIFLFNNVGQRLPWCLWRETSGQTSGAFSAVPSVRHSLRTGSENARGHAARPLASAYTRHFECEDLQSQSEACPRTRARGHRHAPRCRPGWTAGWSWQISKAWRRKTPQMKTLTRVPATAAAAQQAPATLMDTNSHAVLVVISTWSSVVAAAGSLQEVPSHLRHK